MSFLKKAMASVGIGSAKVDTVLNTNQIRVGEEIFGQIRITGGKIEQKIDKVYLELKTYYMKEDSEGNKTRHEVVIKKADVVGEIIVKPNDKMAFDFGFTIPFETPITLKQDNVWFATGLDIKMAIDPSDKDYVKVIPHQSVQMVIEAMARLGFELRKVENEHHKRGKLPFVQEFEFKPNGYSQFKKSLDEVEMIFNIDNNGLEIFAEIDRKARGIKGFFAELANLDERYAKTYIQAGNFNQNIDQILLDFISANM